jgi:hypothetical protein
MRINFSFPCGAFTTFVRFERYTFMNRLNGLLVCLIIVFTLSGCSLFRKKCDCPDHHKQKRVAQALNMRPSFFL